MKKPTQPRPARTPRKLTPEQLAAATGGAGVDMNPLYVGNDAAADNPLYA